MGKLRHWIRQVFGYSRREANGFLILLLMMLLLIGSKPMQALWLGDRDDDFSEERFELDSLLAIWNVETPPERDDTARHVLSQPFEFNPNVATADELNSLGFSAPLAKRIVNYRRKGGSFRVKSDLLKIYGMDSSFYLNLQRFIELPEFLPEKAKDEYRSKSTTQREKDRLAPFDVNRADTTELKSVYGIGSKLASRIVKFRDRLGGFVNEAQFSEVFGLDSVVVAALQERAFIAEDYVPVKININNATEEDLSKHPYVKRNVARSIVAWRFQHGRFSDLAELKKLHHLRAEDIDKISPYLKLDD